jgi:hypothetical protein
MARVNDLLGFLAIGDDGGNCLIGIVYLKRRFVPREMWESNGEPVAGLPPPTDHLLCFAILAKAV